MIHLKRSTFLAINVAIMFGIQLVAITSESIAAEKQTIRLGSARLGSSGYIQFEAISYLVNQYSDQYKASSISTAGGTENIALLGEQKIDFGSGDSLGVVYSWKEKNIPIWQVSSWAYWSIPMIVLADSGIDSIEDLRGKPVSLINKGSGTELGWSILLEEYGVLDDIKKQFLSWGDSYDAVADGIIAAAPGNYASGKPNPAVQRLGARRDYKVLDIDLDILKRAQKRNPGLLTTTLPKTAYEGFEDDITTVGWSGIIMSTANVDDEMVYELCKAMYEHLDELHKLSAVAGATTKESAVKWLMSDYPVHPGAARYYKEIGVWDENLKIGKR
jgi:TRAP transporter TAXI family solute receptor